MVKLHCNYFRSFNLSDQHKLVGGLIYANLNKDNKTEPIFIPKHSICFDLYNIYLVFLYYYIVIWAHVDLLFQI